MASSNDDKSVSCKHRRKRSRLPSLNSVSQTTTAAGGRRTMSPVRLLQTDTQVRDAALELLAGLRPLAEDDEAAAYGHGVERLQEARVEAEGGFAAAPARYELGRRSALGSPGPLPRPCVPGCRGGDRSGCTAALTRSLPSRCLKKKNWVQPPCTRVYVSLNGCLLQYNKTEPDLNRNQA